MKPKFEHEWDFLEWKTRNSVNGPWLQKDWNHTLITKINQTSAQIFKESHRGGANLITVHPKTFCILKGLDYFHVNGSECSLAGRYKIKIDDKLNPDCVRIQRIDEQLEEMRKIKPNLCYAIKVKQIANDSIPELILKFVEHYGDEEYTTEDGFKVITDSMVCGEIKIKNHHTVDPITGEILIDYHTEISEDIWMPSPRMEMSESDYILYRQNLAMENAQILSSGPNQTPRKTFVIPVGKPKPKSWYKCIIAFFKAEPKIVMSDIKDSTINIKLK